MRLLSSVGGLLTCALLAAAAGAGDALAYEDAAAARRALRAELQVRAAIRAGDGAGLRSMAVDAGAPGLARGRALWGWSSHLSPPVAAADRVVLLAALEDPAAPVRQAAARAVGHLRERSLERALLSMAAEDPDPRVRAEALRAVRRWTRQGHLYFLDQALGTESERVQGEVLVSLRSLEWREVPPDLAARVTAMARNAPSPFVRVRALETLTLWGQADRSLAWSVLTDDQADLGVRLAALAAVGDGGASREGAAQLLGLLDGDPPLELARAVLEELQGSPRAADMAPLLADYLDGRTERNAATAAIAAFLARAGYAARQVEGAWRVGRR